MELLNRVKDTVIGIIQGISTDWWVEITTTEPYYTYYFGPFSSASEAEVARPGYIEDLESEGAHFKEVAIKRCKPSVLTISHEED